MACMRISASTATEALQRLAETLYHLLVLDIRLEDADHTNIDGISLLGELEKRGLTMQQK